LEGDNQYHCTQCCDKTNAKRFTKLTHLPPVLNLQMLRFIYDRASGHKKKLTTPIEFPEKLDMSKYLINHKTTEQNDKASPNNIYHLGAILMHVGKTAYSGHYMAHIKDFETNKWFNYNDEVITEIKQNKLIGCIDDEVNSNEKVKTDKNDKKEVKFKTSNAYLLVYYSSDFLDNKMTAKHSLSLNSSDNNQLEVVENDNNNLLKWFDKISKYRQDKFNTMISEQTKIKTVYDALWINSIIIIFYFF
jgi:ubiquitin carboxyl-terminal hydrolase 48